MRAVIQVVKQASVTVGSELVSQIGPGLLVLIGVAPDDTLEDSQRLASKLVKARLWPDESGALWKKSVVDIGGKVLCVSQFTLHGTLTKGTKPDFHGASKGDHAQETYDAVKTFLAKEMPNGAEDVGDGRFGAFMDVSLVNDGPTTIIFETRESRRGGARN